MKLHPKTSKDLRPTGEQAHEHSALHRRLSHPYTSDATLGPKPTARFCSVALNWDCSGGRNVTMTDVTTSDGSSFDGETATKKILIVEDDVTAARALRRILTDAGYEPMIYHAGTEALAAAKREHPAAAMIDVHLPDLNGLILAQQIRQIVGDDIPIIMVSGDTSMETLNSLSHVGATYFFSKPLNRNMLVERMKEWVP
jgi:PleD family two-component response regulator